MTKQELSKQVAANSHLSAADAQLAIELAMDIIKKSVASGNGVYLRGFGTFTTKHRAEKKARNISKGTVVIVPAHNIPYFKPSKVFKVK